MMSNTQLEELLVGQPEDVQAEIIRINTEAVRSRLQVALVIPLLAALLGLFNGFRMMRLPEPGAVRLRRGHVLRLTRLRGASRGIELERGRVDALECSA